MDLTILRGNKDDSGKENHSLESSNEETKVSCCHSFKIGVEVPVFLFFFSYGIFTPAQQEFMYNEICRYKYRGDICQFIDKSAEFSQQENAVQADYAVFALWMSLSLFPIAMVTTFVMGTWCDRFSHRLPLIFPHIGSILVTVVYLAYYYFNQNANPVNLAFASFLPGLSGTLLTEIMAAMSYTGLSSNAATRTKRLAILQATLILGQAAGYFANAMFFSKNDLLAFVVQIAVNAYAILLIVLFIPELRTMAQIRQQMADSKVSSWFRYLCAPHLIVKSSLEVVFAKHKFRLIRTTMMITYVFCAAFVGPYSLPSVTYDFLTLQPISLSQFHYSIFMTIFAGAVDVALWVLLPIFRMNWCFGIFPLSDASLAIVGFVSRALAMIAIGFGQFYPTSSPWVYAVVNMLGALPFVSLRAGMSKIYKPSEQGRLFAIVGIIEYTCILLATLGFNALYATLVSSPSSISSNSSLAPLIHGYTFLFCAGLTIVPLILTIWLGVQPIENWSFQRHRYQQM